MIGDFARYLGLGVEYLLFGCAIFAGIILAYGLVKLAWWNLRRSRLFQRDN